MTGNSPVGGPVPPSFGPSYPPPPKPSRAGVWLGSVACMLAAAALVVGLLALVTARREPVPVPQPPEPKVDAQELMDPAADKPLCEVIAPLMKEQTARTRTFQVTGEPDSPARLDAIAQNKADSMSWAEKMQAIVNSHNEPPRYLTRTLQDFVDGVLLYSENMYKGRGPDSFDNDAYTSFHRLLWWPSWRVLQGRCQVVMGRRSGAEGSQ